MLRAAEGAAIGYPASTAGHEGFAVARRITTVISQLRLAAATGYIHRPIENELREQYEQSVMISATRSGQSRLPFTLLTDESVPAAMRESCEFGP